MSQGRAASGAFPAVPTLLTTRLQMELLLADRAVELKAAAGILLNDLGATLEIFRRAGEDCDPACGQRPLRLEDCLASLGTDVWMEVVCAHAVERAVPGSARPEQLSLFWEHGRQMAYVCWLLAQQEDEFCPEEAYLLGLLHEAAALPALLGWVAVPRPGGRLQPETEEGDQARLVALARSLVRPCFSAGVSALSSRATHLAWAPAVGSPVAVSSRLLATTDRLIPFSRAQRPRAMRKFV